MSSKKWTGMFIGTLLLCAAVLFAFNAYTDPFGAFATDQTEWDSYAFTMNPRVGKVAFLESTEKTFDAYIVGSSATSSLPVKALSQHDELEYYNAFVYGADMYDVTKMAKYIIQEKNPEQLILNIGPVSARDYHRDNDPLTYGLHYKTGDLSAVKFYLRYGLINPRYGMEKLKKMREDSFVQNAHDVFDSETGAYDKSKRDVEKIGNLETYLKNYPVFTYYPDLTTSLEAIDEFKRDMLEIKTLCLEKNVELEVVIFPMYGDYAHYFDKEEIKVFYEALVEITDFWDFSLSALSEDPRFFYDEAHFRNAMGEMIVAKIHGDMTRYIPDDFGLYVNKNNLQDVLDRYDTDYTFKGQLDDSSYTSDVTVINYHHFNDELISDATMRIELFREHMTALVDAGYETVHVKDLILYVNEGVELPEKPVLITMDDGYLSNYTEAYEVLKEMNLKSTFFVIGSSVGKDTYKDSDKEIIPHYTYEQAKEMADSGLIEIQSHTYDLHQYGPFEATIEGARESMVMLKDDTEEAYVQVVEKDLETMNALLEEHLDTSVYALAYPRGGFDIKTEILTAQAGVEVTLTTVEGNNTLIKGLPQSLRQLNRFTPWNQMTGEALIDYINPISK